MQADREEVPRNLFRILFAQSIFLALWSLPAQAGPVFVQRFFFGVDLRDFYFAGQAWLHGINPYLRARFVTPPSSLLVASFFAWMPFGVARWLFFALNLTIILASVRACSRRLGLSPESTDYMTGITVLFYPVYFLLERGNLEALILGCLCWAFCTRSRTLRGALVGLAGGLKLYPLLLLAVALRNKQWRFAASTLLAFLLLTLPFYRLAGSAWHVLLARGAVYQQIENISPAAFINTVLGQAIGRWLYLGYWAGTLIVMLYRAGRSAEDAVNVSFLPFLAWMVAFPRLVYPYGGVLLLPVLAWKLRTLQGRKAGLSDKLFVNGFLLVGLQAWALSSYFAELPTVFHLANSLGMCLILGSLAASRFERTIPLVPTPIEDSLPAAAPVPNDQKLVHTASALSL